VVLQQLVKVLMVDITLLVLHIQVLVAAALLAAAGGQVLADVVEKAETDTNLQFLDQWLYIALAAVVAVELEAAAFKEAVEVLEKLAELAAMLTTLVLADTVRQELLQAQVLVLAETEAIQQLLAETES
jgi:hypothetical protein